MRKGLRTAIIVEIIVLVAAFAFSVFYFVFGLRDATRFSTILLIALWVLVAAVLLFVFWSRSLTREEMIRRFYLNNEWIYNHEIGYAPISRIVPDGDAYELVAFAADSLAQMSYGFEVADTPADFKPTFMVSSSAFLYHVPPVDEGEGASADAEECAVVDRWAGSLHRVETDANGENQFVEIGTFENARELARLLEENEALA